MIYDYIYPNHFKVDYYDDNTLEYIDIVIDFEDENGKERKFEIITSNIPEPERIIILESIYNELNPDLLIVGREVRVPKIGIKLVEQHLTIKEYFTRCREVNKYGDVYLSDLLSVLIKFFPNSVI